MKNKIYITPFIIMGLVLIIANSCKKKEVNYSDFKDVTKGNFSHFPTTPSVGNILFNPNLTYGTMTDIDGNVYKTITIGTQTWMAENLRTTRYRDGSPISYITDDASWSYRETEAYCDYNNDPKNSAVYGKLYNWWAVSDSRNIAPVGWHVPNDSIEWEVLAPYSSGINTSGGELKETGTSHWITPNTGATNETGFTALPGGYRCGLDGSFNLAGNWGYYWSTEKNSTYDYFYRSLGYNYDGIHRVGGYFANGFSVRLVKD